MNWKNTGARYGTASITLHWLMLLLLAATYLMIELHGLYPRTARGAMFESWHSMLGLSILLLVIIRLGLRLVQLSPKIVPALSRWQHLSAKAMHGALYLLMLVMPVLGWMLLSAEGHDVMFFVIKLPALVAKNREFADSLKEVHETIGTLGYFLIGLHALAALYHHYFLHDNTLLRMLPSGSKTDQ